MFSFQNLKLCEVPEEHDDDDQDEIKIDDDDQDEREIQFSALAEEVKLEIKESGEELDDEAELEVCEESTASAIMSTKLSKCKEQDDMIPQYLSMPSKKDVGFVSFAAPIMRQSYENDLEREKLLAEYDQINRYLAENQSLNLSH